MKRFFTKKSVALIFVTILLFGFFHVNTAHADFLSIGKWISGAAIDALGGILGIVIDVVTAFINFIILPFISLYLAICGMMLDYAVQYTIYGQGFAAMITVIQNVWTLIRDTANVTFIFLLLWAAIDQIISGSMKKDIITGVIMAAVLVNFSLFITRAIIDAGNLVATALYNEISASTAPSTNATKLLVNSGKTDGAPTVELSGRIMDGLGLTTAYDLSSSKNVSAQEVKGMAALLNAMLQLVLFAVTAWVFMLLALLLIGRFVMLVLLMTLSPVAVLPSIIPGLGPVTQWWWKNLMGQVLIAPTLMFFLLLTIRLSQAVLYQKVSDNLAVQIFSFALIIYMLFKTLEIVKGMSGPIGDIADKIGKQIVGLAMTVATGGASAAMSGIGALGANTVGRAANNLLDKHGEALQEMSSKGGILGGLAGAAHKVATYGSKATYDPRNAGLLQAGLKALPEGLGVVGLSGMPNIDLGKGGGTYKTADGKEVSGYAGQRAKETEEAKKKAEGLDKTSKEYLDKFRKDVQYFTEKEKTLKDKIAVETDKNVKKQLQSELVGVSKQKQTAEKNDLDTQLKNKAAPSFKAADDKVKQLQRDEQNEQKKLNKFISDKAKTIKDMDDLLANGSMTKAQYDMSVQKLEDDEEHLQANFENAQVNTKQQQTQTDIYKKKILNKIENKIMNSTKKDDRILKSQLKARNLKDNYVKSIRDETSNVKDYLRAGWAKSGLAKKLGVPSNARTFFKRPGISKAAVEEESRAADEAVSKAKTEQEKILDALNKLGDKKP